MSAALTIFSPESDKDDVRSEREPKKEQLALQTAAAQRETEIWGRKFSLPSERVAAAATAAAVVVAAAAAAAATQNEAKSKEIS